MNDHRREGRNRRAIVDGAVVRLPAAVVKLGAGDVWRELGADGRWRWSERRKGGEAERRREKDPEVMTGARPGPDQKLWDAIAAAPDPAPGAGADQDGYVDLSMVPMVVGGGEEIYVNGEAVPVGNLVTTVHCYGGRAEVVPWVPNARARSVASAFRSAASAFKRFFARLLAAFLAVLVSSGGCAARVGTQFVQDDRGRTATNAGPNTLAVNAPYEGGETTTATGVGPSSYSVTNGGEVRTLTQGYPNRQIFFRQNEDGTVSVNVASGSDIEAEGVVFDPETGKFGMEKFRTVTSEPIRAGNEGYLALADYWAARDRASRDVLIEQIKGSAELAGDFKSVLITALTGIP